MNRIRVKKIFSCPIDSKPYSLRIGMFQTWLSEKDVIALVTQSREALPKKVQIPFSEKGMPAGKMKVMIPIV
jgi:hypothetical protein